MKLENFQSWIMKFKMSEMDNTLLNELRILKIKLFL
jgi:hypothetical protein